MLFAACGGGEDNDSEDGWKPTGEEIVLIAKGEEAEYKIAVADGDEKAEAGSALFETAIAQNGLPAATDEGAEHEIIFGKGTGDAAKIAAELLEKEAAEYKEAYHWVFYYREGTLVIIATDAYAYERAVRDFFDKYLTDRGIVFKDTLKEHGMLTFDEYLDEQEMLAAAQKKKEHEQYIPDLLALLDTQRTNLDGITGKWNQYVDASETNPVINMFKAYTEDLGAAADIKWDSPAAYPIDEHPRLLLTKDNLPLIRKMLREENATNEYFKSLVDATIPNDCILPEPTDQGVNATLGETLYHNHNESYLIIIQAKALAYLLYGDEYYGYQAILYMKNYLATLEIKEIPSDQTRRYGYVMRAAGIVYDWCYDLLTKEDRIQFIAGVENCICRGRNLQGDKMEVEFPPSKQGIVEGHACEFQILRDYLSFAVAVYGDKEEGNNSSWYEYIAGRVYNDYIPFRDYYYSNAGVAHQGTGYAVGRYSCDLYSAWILNVATGENPYGDSLQKAGWGLFNYEFAPGKIFNDGDKTGDYKQQVDAYYTAYLIAYLYKDSDMLAMADYLMDIRNSKCGNSYNELNAVAYVALRGLCEVKSSGDRYGSMNLIQYNGSPLGQYVVRNSWGDDDAAAIFMRIKERSTGGHEHRDTGTFEIYYKGMLTSDGGIYRNGRAEHTKYYFGATISHNGLIIYNQSLALSDEGYYSGGQKSNPSPGYTFEAWQKNTDMDKGTIIGRQHAYLDDAETQPLYAYIAGDITKAYDSSSVEYVGRRMLTVYTGDAEIPMVFFVYDDIASKSRNFEKRFLLQITSSDEPTIDGKTVITENGGGRLVLTCLSSNVSVNGVGGRAYNADGSYDCVNSKNYLVNGSQLLPYYGYEYGYEDDGHWGRIEIVSTAKSAAATFMNVLYVTDKGNDKSVEIKKVTQANGVEGAVFDEKIAVIFATDRNGATEEISCRVVGEDEVSYYVSGVAAGQWKVTVGGKDYGTYTATEEGRLLTFTAPSGSIVITPLQ